MKKSFSFFFILIYAAKTEAVPSASLAPSAIENIIDKYFSKKWHEIEIINFGVKGGKGEEIVEKVMQLQKSMPVWYSNDIKERVERQKFSVLTTLNTRQMIIEDTKRMHIDTAKKIDENANETAIIQNLVDAGWIPEEKTDFHENQISLNISTVLIFDSPENFHQTINNIKWQPHKAARLHHLVYIHGGRMSHLEALPTNLTLDKVDFLINETGHSIELATAFMFSPGVCRLNHFKVVDRFKAETNK
jgi:hypothetical protein